MVFWRMYSMARSGNPNAPHSGCLIANEIVTQI